MTSLLYIWTCTRTAFRHWALTCCSMFFNYTSSISVFLLWPALDASEPVWEQPSGGGIWDAARLLVTTSFVSVVFFSSVMSPWYIWTYKFCFSAAVSPWCAWTCMRMALSWLPLRCCSFLFIFHYYYASSVSVFQLQQALDAFKPVQERPSGSCLFVTIQVLSLFFSCNEPLMRLNLYKNGPLAVGFLLPYKFSLFFSCNEPLMCLNLYENDPPAVGFEVLPDFVAMQVITMLVLSLCAARLLVTASSVCVFQMQRAFDASEPVRERPSGGGLWGAARLPALQGGHLPPHRPHRGLHSLWAD